MSSSFVLAPKLQKCEREKSGEKGGRKGEAVDDLVWFLLACCLFRED